MRLTPETLAAHRTRHAREKRYPPHTLAPDPHQPELELVPPARPPCPTRKLLADNCPHCGSVHLTKAETVACREGR